MRETERSFAGALCVSPAAVHAWLCGINAPGDVALVLEAERLLGLPRGALLEEPRGGMPGVNEYTQEQRGALRRVYWGFVDFIREYELTDGFNDWWLGFADQGVPGKPWEERILQRADERHRQLVTLLMREAFDLQGAPAWDPLWDLPWEDVIEVGRQVRLRLLVRVLRQLAPRGSREGHSAAGRDCGHRRQRR